MDGKIYMNYLGYFWDPLNGYAEQRDITEGIVLTKNTKQFQIQDELGEHVIGDSMFIAEGYKYCNIACFYRIDVKIFPASNRNVMIDWQEANMKNFGNSVVIIKDVEEFIRRIAVAVKAKNWKYCAGDIEYYREVKDDIPVPYIPCMFIQSDYPFDLREMPKGKKFDSFCKSHKFKNQNEWRISLYRGIKEEKPYTLEVGDLRDIAHLTDDKCMANDFNYLLENAEIKPIWDYRYKGNAKREELRDLFIALGDHKVKLSLIVSKDILPEMPPIQRGDFLERLNEKFKDTLNNFAERKLTKEEFLSEIYRLLDVLKRSYIRVPIK